MSGADLTDIQFIMTTPPPKFSIELLLSMIKRDGHEVNLLSSDDVHCIVMGIRNGDGQKLIATGVKKDDKLECTVMKIRKDDMQGLVATVKKCSFTNTGTEIFKRYPADCIRNWTFRKLIKELFEEYKEYA